MKKKEFILNEGVNEFNIKVRSADVTVDRDNINSPILQYCGNIEIENGRDSATIYEKANNSDSINVSSGRGKNVVIVNGKQFVSNGGLVVVNGNVISGNVVSSNETSKVHLIVPRKENDISLNVSSMSGDIDIINLMLFRLIIKTMSGDVSLKRINSIYSEIETMSGDIKAEILESMLNYDVVLSTMSGEKTRRSEEIGTPSLLRDKHKLLARTMSGDIDVVFKGRR